MMAALMLTVAFIGMIEAVTISARMMDSARRQSLATQIINHEIEKLRFKDWSTIIGLPTSSTAVAIDTQFASARATLGDNSTTASPVVFSLARSVTTPSTNIREVN